MNIAKKIIAMQMKMHEVLSFSLSKGLVISRSACEEYYRELQGSTGVILM